MLRTEILRELATIVMLVALAAAAARTSSFASPSFSLASGTATSSAMIFKVLLDWPHSFFTWDVLFLIPVTSVAPILAPLICTLTMIGLAVLSIALHRQNGSVRTGRMSSLFIADGAGVIIYSFIGDFPRMVLKGGFVPDLAGLTNNSVFRKSSPPLCPSTSTGGFSLLGEALILLSGFIIFVKTTNK